MTTEATKTEVGSYFNSNYPPFSQWTAEQVGEIEAALHAPPQSMGGVVFIGAADSRLDALDSKTGKELWQYQATGGFTGSPAVAGGKMVVATDRGVVYCLGKK